MNDDNKTPIDGYLFQFDGDVKFDPEAIDFSGKPVLYYHDEGLKPLFPRITLVQSDETNLDRWLMPELDLSWSLPEDVERLYEMLNSGDVVIVPEMWKDRILSLSLVPNPGDGHSFDVSPIQVNLDEADNHDEDK